MKTALDQKVWWTYLEEDLQELLKQAFLLADTAKAGFHDYSYIVFPASKAYEGFLKKLFLDLGFITERDYYGKRFRIGKSLNPSLPPKFRNDDWVYDDLVKHCKGKGLADFLWTTWRRCRNLVFHWFPNEARAITLPEAKQRVQQIVDAIDKAYSTCKI